MNIRNKLLSGYFVIVLLFTAMTYYSLEEGKKALITAAAQHSTMLGRTILEKIENNIQQRLEQLQWYGIDSGLQKMLHSSNEQFSSMADRENTIAKADKEWRTLPLEESSLLMAEILTSELSNELRSKFFYFFDLILGNKHFSEVFITNQYGVNIAETNRTSDYLQADEEWWQIARKEGNFIGGIEYHESVGEQGIPLAVRLEYRSGVFLGIIKGGIPLQEVIRTAEIVTREYESTEVQIISDQGEILYSSQALPLGRNISQEPYFSYIQKGNVSFIAKDLSGKTRLYTYVRSPGLLDVPQLNWGVLVSHDRSEMLAAMFILQQRIVLIGGGAIVLLLLVGFFTGRMISKPLKILTRASSAIANGDLDYQIEYTSRDEFGALSNKFSQMARSLSESYKKLRNEIEERKQIEAALKKQAGELTVLSDDLIRRNAELDEFTYIASHDLQEPLRKLTAFSSLLEKDLGGNLPENAKKDLGFISDAASRMQNLIQDLLALSRSGRRELVLESIDLNECVDNALYALATRVGETSAEIKRDVLPKVMGDKVLITQLYQNLIGNALKFIKDVQPRIDISAKIEEDVITFWVQDNGIGILPEYQEQIFQPFKRLHGKTEYDGSGIGLAICRKVIERHGGKIWVTSEEGKGTCFYFSLKRVV